MANEALQLLSSPEILQQKAPNAFDINKHIRNAREGLCSPKGIHDDVVGILSEITGQPLGREFSMVYSGGKLISPDFQKPLVELYAQPTGDPIFDLRASADISFIMQLEERMSREGDFSYLLISPTTEGMSTFSMIEIGQRYGNTVKAKRLSIPHRTNQKTENSRLEMLQLAKTFSPDDERFNQILRYNQELVLASNPIIFDNVNFIDNIEPLVEDLDRRLGVISGIPHKFGRTNSIETLLKRLNFSDSLEIIQNTKDLTGQSIIERYVYGCFAGLGIEDLQKEFNNIINNFMELYTMNGIELSKFKNEGNYERQITWKPQDIPQLAGMCGSIGGNSILNLGGDRFISDIARNSERPDEVKCKNQPFCNATWFVKNGDPDTYRTTCPECGADMTC
ncbi:hypothetical protein KBD45_06565 [Candidatus Dojkabacteria bacterium]|nr:hypothetical protein [Candidatus Dojkabacteria bacterium]